MIPGFSLGSGQKKAAEFFERINTSYSTTRGIEILAINITLYKNELKLDIERLNQNLTKVRCFATRNSLTTNLIVSPIKI